MIIRTIFTLKRISPDYPFKSNQKQAKCWCLCGVCVCCDRGEKQQFVVNFRVSSQNFMRDEGGRMKKTLPCTLYSVMILHLWHPSYCCIHKQKESSGGIHSLFHTKYLQDKKDNVHVQSLSGFQQCLWHFTLTVFSILGLASVSY